MSVVIDDGAKAVFLSVRDLAEDMGFARIGADRGGWASFALGTEVHGRVLASRIAADPAYRKELPVRHQLQLDDWFITITGRIDGAREDADGWHIEEFKTASLLPGPAQRSGPSFERHRRQLLLYCDLWTRLGRTVASATLVYVEAETGREDAVRVAFDPATQAAETEKRLRRVLGEWRTLEEARARKAAFAPRLPFPHEAPRPGQQRLIAAIDDALETGGHLLAEAPTGSGKTAASLHPVLRHCLRHGRQLAFLTSKTLQQQMAMKALVAMKPDGVFRTVQLRAKERMCANDRVLCHEDACPYAKNYPLKMERSGLLDRLMEASANHLPDDVFAAARAEQVCPFEVQLEIAKRADAVVADYNYVFDPGAALTQFRDEGLRDKALVIDEAHNLPDRVREIFSPELAEAGLDAAHDAVRQLEPQTAGTAGFGRRKRAKPGKQLDFASMLSGNAAPVPDLLSALDEAKALLTACAESSLPPDKDGTAETTVPQQSVTTLWQKWEPLFLAYVAWKQQRRQAAGDDPIVDFHFALLRFQAVLGLVGESPAKSGFTVVVERKSGAVRLVVLCLDPAVPAAPVFRQLGSAILLSATLQPFELLRRTLGLEKDRVSTVVVPSPFPPENRRVLIAPQVRTTYAARDKALPQIAGLLAEIDAAHGGNKLVLLPSYDFLKRVAELLSAPGQSAAIPPPRLLVQSAGATETERHALLTALANPPTGGHLLLGVLGGMFAEGVDYPGKLLETVVVVSPGLPKTSFERELLRRYYEDRDGNGFEQAYLQPGMTRVVQAAGRLIRTETDRGVIVLICQRFLEEGYVERLPRDWFRHSARELIAHQPAEEIGRFFQGDGSAIIQPGTAAATGEEKS